MNRLRGFCGAKIGSKIGWKIGSPKTQPLFHPIFHPILPQKPPDRKVYRHIKSERTNEINKVIDLPCNNMRILDIIMHDMHSNNNNGGTVSPNKYEGNFDDTYWNITTTTYRHDDATQANSAATARRPWTLVFYTAVFFHQDFLCHLG